MSDIIKAHDLYFKPFIPKKNLNSKIAEMGKKIAADYQGKYPLFLGVLNGAFVFTADLLRHCPIDCEISFIKLSSYTGTESSGEVSTVIGLDADIKGRHVVIIEDIIDTGETMHQFIPTLRELNPASVELASLLVKRDSMKYQFPIKYAGFEIPSKFVLGYGLDYDGIGRNIPEIYQLCD